MAAAFDVCECGMASETIFNIWQCIKIAGMGYAVVHASVYSDQKYVENLAAIYLEVYHVKLDLPFSKESYQTAFQSSYLTT